MSPQRQSNALGWSVFAMITIICAAIVVNAWVDTKLTKLLSRIENDRGIADTQLVDLQERVKSDNEQETQKQQKPPVTLIPKGLPRILLTDAWLEHAGSAFSQDTIDRLPRANVTTTVAQRDWGISFDIPFHLDWKTEQFEFLPYNGINGSMERGITFGHPSLYCMNTCMIRRALSLEVAAPTTASARMKSLQSDPLNLNPTTSRIPGGTLIRYNAPGMCDDIAAEIITTKQRFTFATVCGTDQDKKDLEAVIKSIRLE